MKLSDYLLDAFTIKTTEITRNGIKTRVVTSLLPKITAPAKTIADVEYWEVFYKGNIL